MCVKDITVADQYLIYDDTTLIEMINEHRDSIIKRREILDREIEHNDKYDYLGLTIARLAYEFTKEEYDALFNEAVKRGLV